MINKFLDLFNSITYDQRVGADAKAEKKGNANIRLFHAIDSCRQQGCGICEDDQIDSALLNEKSFQEYLAALGYRDAVNDRMPNECLVGYRFYAQGYQEGRQ